MNVRKKDLLPGQEAWAHATTMLPAGLEEGVRMMVLGRVPGCWSWYAQEDATGRTFPMDQVNLDNGYEFEVSPGCWVPEHHAAVLDHLEVELARELAEAQRYLTDGARHGLCYRAAGFYARVLRRNGREGELPVRQWGGEQ